MIKNLQHALNANATSVQLNLGNGLIRLLALTVLPDIYDTLSNIPFDPPVNPEATAIIPAHATAIHITMVCQLHDAATSLSLPSTTPPTKP